jgi:hypothetical protein
MSPLLLGTRPYSQGRRVEPTLNGCIFAVPLPDGTHLSGRVLLDIQACLRRRLFPTDSPLPGLGRACLIEMYSAISLTPAHVPSPVLVPGAFIESDSIGSEWAAVGHHVVNPVDVEFPETLISSMHPDGDVAFECGEMRVPLPLDYDALDQVGEWSSRHSAFLWPYTCLRLLGRGDEVPGEYLAATLAGTDLRLSPFREEVYEYLPFPMRLPYFLKQQQLGLQFERLYEL